MGIERLNQYAGLFGFFLFAMRRKTSWDFPAANTRSLWPSPIACFGRGRSLYYPDSGDPAAPWIPEVYGDAMLVNGKLTPYLEVEPRPYRFRMLNAANSRTLDFLALQPSELPPDRL
jgi:spore coat protein A